MNKKSKIEEATPSEIEQALQSLQYPAGEDIYNQEDKLVLSEDQDLGKKTKAVGDGLDVPGSELDDKDEAIGEEDEENNYYSLGGDNHNDLEEDNGE